MKYILLKISHVFPLPVKDIKNQDIETSDGKIVKKGTMTGYLEQIIVSMIQQPLPLFYSNYHLNT